MSLGDELIVFALPWAFALLPLPLLVRWLARAYRSQPNAVYAPFAPELRELSAGSGLLPVPATDRSQMQIVVFILAWVLVIASFARPQLISPPITKTVPTRDMLLAVDLSGSMDTQDFQNAEGETVSRLDAVKEVLDEFLSRREGDRVGLILFGSAPFVQVPFTEDLDACRRLLSEAEVGMAGPRTVVGDAIGLAINVFDASELDSRVLIVLTDGNDTDSRVPPAKAAEIAGDRGITVHTVAVGDPTTVGEDQLDTEALRAVSVATGGEFAFADDQDRLRAIYTRLDEIEARDAETVSHRARRDVFVWPLGAFFVLVFGFHAVLALPRWAAARGEAADA